MTAASRDDRLLFAVAGVPGHLPLTGYGWKVSKQWLSTVVALPIPQSR